MGVRTLSGPLLRRDVTWQGNKIKVLSLDKLIPLIPVTVFIVCAALLVFKPEPFMKLFGNIYWHMGKYTALGKSENTKKYFDN